MKIVGLIFLTVAFIAAVLWHIATFRLQIGKRQDDAAIKAQALLQKIISTIVYIASMIGFSVCLGQISLVQYDFVLNKMGTIALACLVAFIIGLAISVYALMKKKENKFFLYIMNGIPLYWNWLQIFGLGWAILAIVSLFF